MFGLPLGHHAALHWVGDDTGVCIDERALADAVIARLGDQPPRSSDAIELVIDGTLEKVPTGWRATIHTHDGHGQPLGERELHDASGDCHALDDKLVLVLALIVDPDLLERPRAPRIIVTPPTRSTLPSPSSPSIPWRFAAGVSGLAAIGIVPGVGVGAMVAGSIEPPHVWPIEITAALWPHDRGTSEPGGATFVRATAGAAVCPRLVGNVSACVGAQAGAIRATGFGFDHDERQIDPIVDGTVEVRFDWRLGATLSGRVGVGGWVPAVRPKFVFSQNGADVLVYQPAVASLVTEIAVWTRF